MKKTIAIGVALLLGVCIVMSIITPAHAQGQTVFGPEEMTIDRWSIHLSFHQFSADNPGEGVLFVTKNTPDELIKGGFVLLNDQVIALREFLQGDEIVFEREVNLRSTNYLMVFLRGKRDASVTVEIQSTTIPQPPTASITVDPESIILGESATLSWTSTDADTVTIDPGIGAVDPSGSLTITPEETTTYTITATNDAGQATDSVTVTVINPVPTVEIFADPATILYGESSTLSWTSAYAETATIDQGIGEVDAEGSIIVTPTRTTTYTITVSNSVGTASASATVAVQADVEPQPEGSFGDQYEDLIPADSTAGEYDAKRFSVITGLVKDQNGVPLTDVSVTILHHSEYGTAYTDEEGRYSIPAEGGGVMTVACKKEGLITAHRKVEVPWNDIAIAETMVMIPQDTKATTVTFDGDPNTVVTHQSTEVSDEWGTRSCTTVFTGDNTAYLVDEEGNTLQELTTITTRATEFTTPESMPAVLPPNVAYTYCVDMTVDGAARIRFEKPVYMWVDNFLGFDVGMPVPVGTYDRDRGVWVPEQNGVVVKLLDTDNDTIVDALDATGDDLPDDLNNNGSYSDEVQGLSDAQQYQPGITYWRAAVSHFSPCDLNLPFRTKGSATFPNPTGIASTDEKQKNGKPCITYRSNSFVEDRSRIFHEDIPIPGTDITLHYTSSRTDGYHQVITVPASGDTVPASLKRIIVKVEVAGRILEQILDPLPNQKADFEWDGLDHLGRLVKGSVRAQVRVGFVYDAVYLWPADFEWAFGQSGIAITGVQARQEATYWRNTPLLLQRGIGTLAEGWTLSTHHHLSPVDRTTLHKGDGTVVTSSLQFIDTVAGDGTSAFNGDGIPAVEAAIGGPYGVALDAEGNLYIAPGQHRIRKVDTNGIITTVAGNGIAGFSGDGGPAVEAQLCVPYDVTVDSAGNLYIADFNNHRVRKVDVNGIITTVAGGGSSGLGDGGPATQASLYAPSGVAADSEGNLYISEAWGDRVRKVDVNGIITTVAGGGSGGLGDGGPATDASFDLGIFGIAVDNDGNLYIGDYVRSRIRKVDTAGIITTVAGVGGEGYSGDDGPAVEARLNYARCITVDKEGNLYIGDTYNQRIRKVDTHGIITTVAGSGPIGQGAGAYSGDGGLATEARLSHPYGVAVDPHGNLYIADRRNARVRKVGPPSAFAGAMGAGDIPFADENGVGHIMASSGRHKQTIDLDTGKVLYEFGYDEENRLVSIADRFGNQTTITRDGSGVPLSITSPDGITTYLAIDGNNHLTAINYPDGSTYNFEYTPDGLMTAKIEPEGNRFEHIFNESGRITDAQDEEGGHWQFSRQTYANGDVLTEVVSAEGDTTSYLDHTYSTGAYTSTITGPTGAQTTYARSADGLVVNKNLPCGMEYAFKYGVDPEYKFQVVKGMWETTTNGLERVTLRDKTYQDTNADQVPDRITETVAVNSKATTLVTDTLASTRTLTSPMGRTVTTLYDPDTLLTNTLSIPGLFDTTYGYDGKGRLAAIKTNTRQTDFTYTPQGFLESITDPEDHTTSYAYDAVGRMTGIARPDGSSIGFDYDQNGNMTVLTTPSSINHGFGYNRVNRNTSYQTPISGTYSYVYDRDRRLTQIKFPSGLQINNIYTNGRLAQIQTPEGDIDFTYYCANMVESITKGAESIVYGYDGQLVTSETLSGTLNQTLGYTYNNDFNLTGFTYAGGTTGYAYDNDSLLTGAGNFTITRNANNGLPEAVAGGALNLTRSFNGYGEVDGQGFNINGYNLASWNLARDNAGRIVQKQESINGTTADYVYSYDAMGRLLSVTKDGNLVEEYKYGAHGARISEINILRGITTARSFSYSDEDHLLTTGNTTYQYDADGFLVSKSQGAEVTEYAYSSRGELLQVKFPDGKVINYLYDPLGRRIAKVVDGVITEKYLWQNLTKLLAVYDGNDNLLMRYEYADSRIPVAMTSAGNTYYLTYDQVGSLRLVSDVSGNVVKQIEYDSFGNIINDTDPSFTIPFGFAGGLHDPDTGLVRFGLRDYDPDIARWTSKDPIGFKAGYADLYSYCLNNPINFIDPLGLNSWRYDLSDETLYYLDDDGNTLDSWPAVSGPWDPGALPAGSYTLPDGPCALPESQEPYCDPSGNCWWQAIEPDFDTDRDGFGIHPDGNVEGTEGCIGATSEDTSDLYETLLNNPGLNLEVVE